MAHVFDPLEPAKVLFSAWQSGELHDSLPQALRPQSLDQGYAIQDELFRLAGGERAGWKLGVGSPAAMRAGNLSRPLVGQLESKRCHESGAQVRLPAQSPVTIECEIGFVLARTVSPRVGGTFAPEDIRSTCLTFEVVRSRFVDRKSVGWPSFAGDNVGFEALIIGHPACDGIDPQILRSLAEESVVHLDGEPVAKGLFGDTATDPLASLQHLYDHAAERGETLREGDIVSTGAMCQPFDLQGGGHRLSVSYLGQELVFTLS